MATSLRGKKVAFLATDGVEQSELTGPWKALEDAGAELELLSLKPGTIQMMQHDEKGDTFPVDKTVAEANSADYAGLVLPGGVANPDRLRQDKHAVQFAREFMSGDKPVAAICHGPWLLVEADAVRGRKLTSWPSLQTDIRNAGGEWSDREVITDEKLITSRKPADIPAFSKALVEALANGGREESKLDRMVEQSFPASDPLPGPSSIGGEGASKTSDEREARA
ncbi:MAG TPA: type 1 glutamine amidotransferase domain-containing protein [Gemmatimonadaceae bacterium]|nr:type 1 glutamine amidotransferase domain-containing protein [Gemmatimonadaceae bacterium]